MYACGKRWSESEINQISVQFMPKIVFFSSLRCCCCCCCSWRGERSRQRKEVLILVQRWCGCVMIVFYYCCCHCISLFIKTLEMIMTHCFRRTLHSFICSSDWTIKTHHHDDYDDDTNLTNFTFRNPNRQLLILWMIHFFPFIWRCWRWACTVYFLLYFLLWYVRVCKFRQFWEICPHYHLPTTLMESWK